MKIAIISNILLISACINILADQVHVVNKDIKYGTRRTLLGYLNVHESDESWLDVKGKRFSDLAGFEPYYLEVPGSDYLFFIKREKSVFRSDEDEKFSYHFLSVSRGEIVFRDDLRLMANSLGRKHDPKFYVRVKQLSPSVILVTERQASFFWYYKFDLLARKVEESWEKIK